MATYVVKLLCFFIELHFQQAPKFFLPSDRCTGCLRSHQKNGKFLSFSSL